MTANLIKNTHIFTSCTTNYIPKARVLGKTLKKFHPDIKFHLILSDIIPSDINLENESFDSIITIAELDIPNQKQWLFKHSVVEMCTGVKGLGFREIFKRYNCENVIFFDPDIAIFSPLDELLENFNHHSILLTPHQIEPEKSTNAIIDNEICFLRHGTFNLGFLGVKNSSQGQNFLQWWSSRCLEFCYDDTPNGLFTDQRWLDLAPAFFTDLTVLRNPAYNIANWNLSNRKVTGNFESGFFVNDYPLCFYHFSNSQDIMPDKYDLVNPCVADLLQWYASQCAEMGQQKLSKIPCYYSFFDNQELITYYQRLRYRNDLHLQEIFKNPFDTSDQENCYYNWFRQEEIEINQLKEAQNNKFLELQRELEKSKALIEGMESSKFWKIRQNWFTFKKLLGLKTDD